MNIWRRKIARENDKIWDLQLGLMPLGAGFQKMLSPKVILSL